MLRKIARLARYPMLLEIGGRGAGDEPGRREPAHDQGRVLQHADTDRSIEPLTDEIRIGRTQGDID